MANPLVIVTGKNGQLGWEISRLSKDLEKLYNFVFVDVESLDLSKPESIAAFFIHNKPAYFIHCAAYTAVDKAETEQELVYKINSESVGEIAKECAKINCPFITISTDYVFDGKGTSPYKTDLQPNPLNYYGYSKWVGEKLALENWRKSIIIRTAWVYSSHAHNFVKTMLRLMKEGSEIKVVSDQVGSPTYAADLAQAILQIVQQLQAGNKHYGVYHFTNSGIISWYDFAVGIKKLSGLDCTVLPVPSTEYPTPAKRPAYSVMDTHKIVADFGVELKDWNSSLQLCIEKLLVSND
jgi:dTDP-4-dehydrorhamnose reductase